MKEDQQPNTKMTPVTYILTNNCPNDPNKCSTLIIYGGNMGLGPKDQYFLTPMTKDRNVQIMNIQLQQ